MSDVSTTRLPFPEELLSGYLDGVLTQQQEQHVRVALEESQEARDLLRQLQQMREASMSTTFREEDRQWSEAARTATSRWSRRLGFVLLVLWGAGMSGYALWEMARGTESWLEKSVVFGGLAGVVLLFFSVLLDRLRDRRTDRYEGVEK